MQYNLYVLVYFNSGHPRFFVWLVTV